MIHGNILKGVFVDNGIKFFGRVCVSSFQAQQWQQKNGWV